MARTLFYVYRAEFVHGLVSYSSGPAGPIAVGSLSNGAEGPHSEAYSEEEYLEIDPIYTYCVTDLSN